MKVLDGLAAVEPPFQQSVLTIGNFDGVHRAHQQLLARARSLVGGTAGPLVVLTFEPHPLSVVAPDRAPQRLQPLEEKLIALDAAGADVTVVARSEPGLLGLEAEEFVERIVRQRFHPAHIVEGPSFGFGRGRRGTPETLVSLASRFGCTVHIVDPITLQLGDGRTELVSSSLIRRLIAEGKVEDAQRCLGRPYVLTGQVVSGDGRGRQIGFPTANVAAAEQLIPADGVYAGRSAVRSTDVGGMTYRCAISIGHTPTFGGQRRLIEVHLLDFDESIYGSSIRVEFERFLRSQKAFESPDALVRQLHRDVEDVRRQRSKD